MAPISAKVQRQKLERNEQLAKEAGMTHEAYMKEQEKEREAKNQRHDETRAAKKGISVEYNVKNSREAKFSKRNRES